MNYSIPGFPVLHYLLGLVKFVSTKSVMSSSHLILCCPLLLLPSIVLSNRVFSNESALRIWWPSTGASASASVLPVSIQGWFPLRLTDLPAVPGTLKSLLHHHNLKSSILGACSNSCPLSWWYHPTISSSVVPFSSCLQSFSATGSFPMSQFLTSGGQSIGLSASATVLPMNIQGWFPLELAGLIPLQSKGLSRVFSSTPIQKHQFFSTQHLSKLVQV